MIDSFRYGDAEYHFMTYGMWRTVCRRGEAKKYSYVIYLGRRSLSEVEFPGVMVQPERIPHGDVSVTWKRKLIIMIEESKRIMRRGREVVGVVCDETKCLFWRVMKLLAETRMVLESVDAEVPLLFTHRKDKCALLCVKRGTKECEFTLCNGLALFDTPFWPVVIPIDACLMKVYGVCLSDAIDSWERCLRTHVFEEKIAEEIANGV
jgi:hypothetical protein